MTTSISKLALAVTTRLVLPMVAVGTLLPACELVTDFGPRHYQYTLSARLLNLTDGTVASVSYGDALLEPGAPAMARFSALDATPAMRAADALFWWKRYLHQQFRVRRSEPGFAERFGSGSDWCFLQTIVVQSERMRTGGLTLTAEVGVAEPVFEDCRALPPQPEECQNPDGVTPILELAPASSFDFPDVGVGFDSGRVAFTLRNRGAGTLCLDVGRLEGFSAESFTLDRGNPTDADSCAPHTGNVPEMNTGRVLLTDTETCTFHVSFHPGRPYLHTARIDITTNDPVAGGESTLELTGHGLGGILRLNSADPPSTVIAPGGPAVLARACVPPYPPAPAEYRAYLQILNSGPGIVTITSMPSDAAWPMSDFLIIDATGMVRRPPGAVAPLFVTSSLVLQPMEQFRFVAVATSPGGLPPTGMLRFAGNQERSPFAIDLLPAATCP